MVFSVITEEDLEEITDSQPEKVPEQNHSR